MSSVEQEITRLFRVRKTILQMLRDRGYAVLDDKNDLGMSREEFEERFQSQGYNREALTMLKAKADSISDQIYIFFPNDHKVGVKPIRNYSEMMERDGIRRAIVVVSMGMTPSAKQAVQFLQPKLKLEIFAENELLVNITEHILVPKHLVLSREEKLALLKRYHLKESQLPRMQQTDPVSRYYGLSPGQVVKITRPSETAGRYVTYRLVV